MYMYMYMYTYTLGLGKEENQIHPHTHTIACAGLEADECDNYKEEDLETFTIVEMELN